jgi:hypothetical protein
MYGHAYNVVVVIFPKEQTRGINMGHPENLLTLTDLAL